MQTHPTPILWGLGSCFCALTVGLEQAGCAGMMDYILTLMAEKGQEPWLH